MEQSLLELRQGNRIVDAYATKFLRLGSFVPTLVAKERERAHGFKQGLSLEI